MQISQSKLKEIILITALIVLGILTRTVFHIGPNFEFITAIGIISGYYLKNKYVAMAIPTTILMITDVIIGNTAIYLFTWSAFLVSPLIGMLVQSARKNKISSEIKVTGGGFLSVLFFYLWTNFGVVVLSNMYTKDFSGLISSYINALPFLRNQVISCLIVTPVLFWIVGVYYDKSLRIHSKKELSLA